ncbi:MAG: pyruvate dehydrogenase (acetyl-transferring) E1 component subunit alpha [Desulfomonile tiedjei]|nr:pyruvate dehydrogenase (acetyl-transferring) E1 component subunit alpha [Desulfomonile tiedjei]
MKEESNKDLIQVMDPDGRIVDKSALKAIKESDMLEMYRLMNFTRLWNSKALSLQRQGRMGTLASVRGQEASNVGMGLALGPEDWFCPSFREYGAMFARGIRPEELYRYWGGDERGARPLEGSRVMPVCITVGSHLLHAAGIAWGAKIRGERIAVMSSSGDGSTSQGDFHEALNFAGVFKLPVVFAIQNNHWAISVPVEKQTASETLAEKACAYGIRGARVDGNDIIAVYSTVKKLLDVARSDYRPALVELVTYRMDDHTTADDASRYRTKEMLAPWQGKDPIDRLRKYLSAEHGWDDQKEKGLIEELTAEVEQCVKEYEGAPHPPPEQIFEHTYAELPWHLREEREELLQQVGDAEK